MRNIMVLMHYLIYYYDIGIKLKCYAIASKFLIWKLNFLFREKNIYTIEKLIFKSLKQISILVIKISDNMKIMERSIYLNF